MTSTRIDFGDELLSPGQRQPVGSVAIDAFGLAQAQLTFALDSSAGNLTDAIDSYSAGLAYPDDLGFSMKSYKYHISTSKGGVAMLTVDYMGVARGVGYTDAQITGVANTTAQPIETHPNFSEVTDSTIGADSPTQLLAGKPPSGIATNSNNPIFLPVNGVTGGTPQWQFAGFGVTKTDSTALNPKAGIRQFLRPMANVRGVIFFDSDNGDNAGAMINGVGRTLKSDGDMDKLIMPSAIVGALSHEYCLLTAANAECIGTPSNYAAIKVTYDIMIAGQIGWDPDIYGPMESDIF
jgi:hypothetical protein